jgi:dihydroorotase
VIFGFEMGVGECEEMKLCNPEQTLERAREYADHIIGVKVRVGKITSGKNKVAPLLVAKQASDELGKPLMTHIDKPPPSIEEVVQTLGSGDILTHCFRPHPNDPVTESGSIKKEVMAARDRGVVFDVGHGRGSLGFGSATKMMELGFDPDVVSSDVHSQNIDGPVHDLLHVMSKFMALGMSFEKVIEKTTIAPARAIDQTDLGHLGVGALGDATILHQEKGRFEYFDVIGERVESDNKLVCDGLVINGEIWQ